MCVSAINTERVCARSTAFERERERVCVTMSAMKALDTSHFSQLQSKRTDQIHFFHRFCDDTETSTPKSDFC